MMHFKDITVKIKEEQGNSGTYEISPLPRGYGYTLANSLRRILLSSLEGGAITEVNISGIDHEYSTLPGMREDILEVLLNLKTIKFKVANEEAQICKLSFTGEGVVKASDIELSGAVEVMNPDVVIANLTDSTAKLEMELKVEKGVGYLEASKDKRMEKGRIQLDADFSPIQSVTYEVLQARKGQQMNLDAVFMTIASDGSISPRDALLQSSEILQDFAGKVMASLGVPINEVEEKALAARTVEVSETKEDVVSDEMSAWKVEDLPLSKRSKTGLLAGGYKTIGDLKEVSRNDLLSLPGFGNKSFNEVFELLKQYNIEVKNN